MMARILSTVVLCLAAASVHAADLRVKVLRPAHRPAETLLPALKPLVSAPGSVSAFHGQLIITGDDATIGEIEQVVAALDQRARSLVITVRHGFAADAGSLRGGGSVDIGSASARPGQARMRVLSTRSRTDERDYQRIRVLEGESAFISTGQDIPVGQRSLFGNAIGAAVVDSIDFRRADTGFTVRANLVDGGNREAQRVSVAVAAGRTRPARGNGGRFDVTEASTRMVIRLGQWVELGGNIERAERGDRGIGYRTHSRPRSNRQIFIRVDEVR